MTGIERLALPGGGFAMVALDQRESLRTIMRERIGRPVDDDDLRRFKVAAAQALTPHASGLLLDTDFGLEPVLAAGALSADCGLIVAADRLVQTPGGPVEETEFDDTIDASRLAARGAVALKLLVLWRRPGDARLARTVERFLAACRIAGLASVLEGIVRPDEPADREEAIIVAAGELGGLGPDLYKAEVPLRGRGDPDELARRSAGIGAALACPWVVLSNGVEAEDFPAAVRAACRGGASGFLAGRAVWTDSIERDGETALDERLRARAVPRLLALRAIVETETALHGVARSR